DACRGRGRLYAPAASAVLPHARRARRRLHAWSRRARLRVDLHGRCADRSDAVADGVADRARDAAVDHAVERAGSRSRCRGRQEDDRGAVRPAWCDRARAGRDRRGRGGGNRLAFRSRSAGRVSSDPVGSGSACARARLSAACRAARSSRAAPDVRLDARVVELRAVVRRSAAAAARAPSRRAGSRLSGALRLLRPWLALAVVALVGFLAYRALAEYSVDDVLASLRKISGAQLGAALGFTVASFVCLSASDALAVRYAGRRLAYPKIALASFTSVSIGHLLGFAALSSGALRYRFYGRWGFSAGDVGRVVMF